MSWNYRIIYHPPYKFMVGKKEFEEEEYLAIHEVYYDEHGIPEKWTIDEIMTGDTGSDSLVSLKWMLENMLKALDRKILQVSGKELIEIEKEKQNEFGKSIEDKKQVRSEDSDAPDGHTKIQ